MSEPSAIRLTGVGKMYRLHDSRWESFAEAVGINRFFTRRDEPRREMWALRGIDLDLPKGHRIGIIGRNGAGKSTLLKLITGNLAPTEGEIEVTGTVQALMTAGQGFHPEFDGFENMRAALTYQGLNRHEMKIAIDDIIEFTELEEFLDQPIKTYSSGMLARLAFAVATAIKPEILIIDEMLGAGDGYFLAKSSERMRALVDSGASILLVSHSTEQITLICEETIWLDRGQVVQRGPSLEVVKAYQQFINDLNDRRLKAKNRKVHAKTYNVGQQDGYTDTLTLNLFLTGAPGAECDVSRVALEKDGVVEDLLMMGSPQDTLETHSSFILPEGDFSDPKQVPDGFCRTLVVPPGEEGAVQAAGQLVFNLFNFFEGSEYRIGVSVRRSHDAILGYQLWRNGEFLGQGPVPVEDGAWSTYGISVDPVVRPATDLGARPDGSPAAEVGSVPPELQVAGTGAGGTITAIEAPPRLSKRRWPGLRTLVIDDVRLLDSDDREKTVFDPASRLRVEIVARANQADNFEVTPTVSVYRAKDGVLVSNHAGPTFTLELAPGDVRRIRLEFPSLLLGDGYYVISVGLYKLLSRILSPVVYDLLDRSFEFQVVGNAPFDNGIFRHPAEWTWR